MFWSSPAESSVFLLLLVCYNWSVKGKKKEVRYRCKCKSLSFDCVWMQSYDTNPNEVSWSVCCLQDGLIQQCGETMKENISAKTVCGYYACASIYGLDSVMKKSDSNSPNLFQITIINSSFCNLYVFVYLLLQVSWVASEQPDDPPKCRPDERTWVCVFNSQFFSFYIIFYPMSFLELLL